MKSDLKHYTEAIREAWNEVMPRHQQAAKQKWNDSFSRPGFVALDEAEIELLQQVLTNSSPGRHPLTSTYFS